MAFSRKALKARGKLRAGRRAEEEDPYYAGDAAWHKGLGLDANPHKPGTEDHAAWAQGHQEARDAQGRWTSSGIAKELTDRVRKRNG